MYENDCQDKASLAQSKLPSKIDWYLKDEKGRYVCNFIPEPVSLVKCLSSVGNKESVLLHLHFKNGDVSEATMLLVELDRTEWFKVDKRCIINSDYRNANKYIGNVIRSRLREVPTEIRYIPEKLGIYHAGSETVFVAGNRVITRSSAENLKASFELQHPLARLDIDAELTKQQAFEGMSQLISISPEIGKVLVAHIISGFIREAFKKAGFTPCAVLVIVGESGMLKSHYVPHLVQLYNRADEIKPDTRFNSTQRFIEDILYENSECTTVIDDLHTAQTQSIKRINETTAEEIIRRVSDDTGRGHKEGNAVVQKRFRGNAVFIGEYTIGQGSTMPRALVVNLANRPDGKILDEYQRHQPLLVSTFYYYFLQWYVDYFDEICEWIDKRLTDFRKNTANLCIHGRLLDTQFYLQTSYAIFLEFCKDSNFISENDALDEYSDFMTRILELIKEQQARYRGQKTELDGIDYLNLIRDLYKKGKIRLANNVATFNPDIHDGLIYYECLCLRRKNFEKLIHKRFPNIRIDEVIEFLNGKQALKRDKSNKYTVKISTLSKAVGAIRFYAIKLEALGIG